MISPFQNEERVCFIGDSITAWTLWISHIADFYSKQEGHNKVSLFPCGTSGGSCMDAITYYQQQTLSWSPTTVVIMLGMNDICRDTYGANRTADMIEYANQAIERYERNLSVLSGMIKSRSEVKRIIYLAPTPYDEQRACSTENLVGCWEALKKCGEICRRTAENYGGEFYDLGAEMYQLMCEAKALGSENELISEDRVHPTNLGFCVMARLFLTAQGFTEMHVTAKDIASGEAKRPLSDAAKAYNDAGDTLQSRWTAERIIAPRSPDQTLEGKMRFAEEFAKTTDMGFYRNYAQNYRKLVTEESACRQNLLAAIEKLHTVI